MLKVSGSCALGGQPTFGSIRQEDDRSTLSLVDEDDAIAAPASFRPIIHTKDTRRCRLEQACARAYAAIILDVLLPGMDGFEVCRRLRREQIKTPILMLTVRDAVQDRVLGLDSGADDYLTKPFALEELLARIRALTRRATMAPSDEILMVGDLRLDTASHEVCRAGHPIELTAQEFALLEFLMRNPGRILSHDQILDRVWGYDVERSSNVVELYIHYLRRRIDRGSARPLIRTIRRVGYTIKP